MKEVITSDPNEMQIVISKEEIEKAFTSISNYIEFLKELETITGIPITQHIEI